MGEDEKKLFVGKLPNDIQEDELKIIFGTYGTVTQVHIMDTVRGPPGQEQRSAFVTYETVQAAKTAIDLLNDVYKFREDAQEAIHCSVARPKGSGKGVGKANSKSGTDWKSKSWNWNDDNGADAAAATGNAKAGTVKHRANGDGLDGWMVQEIQTLVSKYELDDRLEGRLRRNLGKRKSTFAEDMRSLEITLESARVPGALLNVKMREMEEGTFEARGKGHDKSFGGGSSSWESYDRNMNRSYDDRPSGAGWDYDRGSGYDRGYDRGAGYDYDSGYDRGGWDGGGWDGGGWDGGGWDGGGWDRDGAGYDHGGKGYERGSGRGQDHSGGGGYDRGGGGGYGVGGYDRGKGGGYDRGNSDYDRSYDPSGGREDGGGKGGDSRGSKGGTPGPKLYVGNLPEDIDREAMDMVFTTYGKVEDIHIMTGRSKTGQASAFIVYSSPKEAATAIAAMQVGYEIRPGEGNIVVKYADADSGRKGNDRQRPF